MSGTLTREARGVRRPGVRRRPGALPHLVGLDGIRAIAVLAVVLYHADLPWIPGGFLGVDVFFVLSGFLITSLLLIEFDRSGRLDYRGFYLRRARRLLPAMFAVLAFCAVLVVFVAPDVAAGFRHDLPGALLYFSNWLNIVSDTSYFDFIGRPPMLKHLWSLAVEEQFYLIWPTVALLAYRWRGPRMVFRVAAIGAVISTLALVVGSVLGDMPVPNDPSRLYFGTDTHAMGVMVGAALAVIWRPGRTMPVLPRQTRAVLTSAGLIALGLLVVFFLVLGEYSTFLYRGGFLVVSLVTAVVVAAASHRGIGFGRVLGVRPMRWVGERSYGIYLWHWPLFVVTRPGVDIPWTGGAALALRLVLLLAIAEASYRYLEMPIRRGALGRWWVQLRAGNLKPLGRLGLAISLAVVLFAGFVTYRVATAPAPEPPKAANEFLQPTDELPAEAKLMAIPPVRDAVDMVGVATRSELNWARRLADGSAAASARASQLSRQAHEAYGIEASAFGDSVLLGAAPALERGAFNLDLYARVAQQAASTAKVLATQAAAGALRPVVIIHTGNNGIIAEKDLRAMLTETKNANRVVLVNTRVPRSWSAPNNRVIAAVAKKFENVRLVDWSAISASHRDYFVKDGVHLTWAGAQVYSDAIEAAATAK